MLPAQDAIPRCASRTKQPESQNVKHLSPFPVLFFFPVLSTSWSCFSFSLPLSFSCGFEQQLLNNLGKTKCLQRSLHLQLGLCSFGSHTTIPHWGIKNVFQYFNLAPMSEIMSPMDRLYFQASFAVVNGAMSWAIHNASQNLAWLHDKFSRDK